MAKLYRTSGTGNAQQTLDVNDEKIKIYADEASLDADLANIGENEIVATNEEDSQRAGTQYPVDVVQDGNMNAVTSNAVYDALGMNGWTRITTLSNSSYIEGKTIGTDKIVHIHLEGYLGGSSVSIGQVIYTITDSDYVPSSVKRAMGVVQMSNGRYALDIDINSSGSVVLYPIIHNQYSGSIGTIEGLFGDFWFVIN